ncbi:MAG: phosphopentomutase [Lachnospiraceae bacterium]|nr:phosphopentomutase [Lachnospiraceae bacterium]
MFKRIFLVVMDSVGIGETPKSPDYDDAGANTIVHIAESMHGLYMPNMERLGYGNIIDIAGIQSVDKPKGFYTKMDSLSVGKDTLAGHWELMGVQVKTPFKVFPNGFPKALIDELEKQTGRRVIGNIPASGTEILVNMGQEQVETGALIVYTSADSVLQIAAHEEVVPLEELYRCCEIARALTMDARYLVGRIIARPFVGTVGNFKRTANRHDYALKPFGRTTMNELHDAGLSVISIGKINDIYSGEGVTASNPTKSNDDGMDKLVRIMQEDFTGLCFLNLVDFDSLYGHRRDPIGYGQALEAFDVRLGEVLERLTADDLLILTADHGNDPIHHGTDHTKEYVPLVVYSPAMSGGDALPQRSSFADVGATVAENFKVGAPQVGKSFLKEIEA